MGILSFFLDIFFPPRCCGCKREGSWLCSVCRLAQPPVWHEYAQGIWYFYALHESWTREAIHLLKYEGIPSLAHTLIREVQRPSFLQGAPCFVPVPSSNRRLKKRGYNQAQLLAVALAQTMQGSVCTYALKKKERESLVGHGKKERQAQAYEQFVWAGKSPPAATQFIVVDDVLTTGSTLSRCIELLQEHVTVPVIGCAVAYDSLDTKKPEEHLRT